MKRSYLKPIETFSVAAGLALLFMGTIGIAKAQSPQEGVTSNKKQVEAMLIAWKNGTGELLPLLDDNVRWTITGNSLGAGTTVGKPELVEKILNPFGARFASSANKFKPTTIRGIYGDGDTVIANFDGYGISNDGKPYSNSYVWILRMHGGKVVEATAFFDAVAFDDLWTRVKPQP